MSFMWSVIDGVEGFLCCDIARRFDPGDDATAAWCEQRKRCVPRCPVCRATPAVSYNRRAFDLGSLDPRSTILVGAFALRLATAVGQHATPAQVGLLACTCPVKTDEILRRSDAPLCPCDAAISDEVARLGAPRRTFRQCATRHLRWLYRQAWATLHGGGPAQRDVALTHACTAALYHLRDVGMGPLHGDPATERANAVAFVREVADACRA